MLPYFCSLCQAATLNSHTIEALSPLSPLNQPAASLWEEEERKRKEEQERQRQAEERRKREEEERELQRLQEERKMRERQEEERKRREEEELRWQRKREEEREEERRRQEAAEQLRRERALEQQQQQQWSVEKLHPHMPPSSTHHADNNINTHNTTCSVVCALTQMQLMCPHVLVLHLPVATLAPPHSSHNAPPKGGRLPWLC